MNIYSDNKTLKYTFQLPRSLKSDPAKWEAGLIGIQFPDMFYTIQEDCNTVIREYTTLIKED